MVQIQGIKIGITVSVFVFALLTVNVLTAAAGIPVQLSASGLSQGEVDNVAGDFKDPEVTGVGSQDPGIFGVIVGVTRTIQQLVTITTGLEGILEGWGAPAVVGLSVQTIVDLTMGIGILQILMRFRF